MSARKPSHAETNYAVRAPLVRWLEAEAARADARRRILDVGCGVKPYEPLFRPYASYVGVDVGNPAADLEGAAEALPVDDASFDLVLCTQTLEHCRDPAAAVRELRRVVEPGGRVLASTHGTQVYHPSPQDYWRWTHEGLRRLFEENAAWASVEVTPGAGTATTLAMLLGTYVEIAARRTPLSRPPVWLLNRIGAALDARVRSLREPVAGSLIANFHVVATA